MEVATKVTAGVEPVVIKKVLDIEDQKEYVLWVPACQANPGDTIVWDTGGRSISIWFPEEGIFPSPALFYQKTGEENGNKLEMTIPRNCKKSGTFEYCIYCHDDDKFVECASHPKLIIPVPN